METTGKKNSRAILGHSIHRGSRMEDNHCWPDKMPNKLGKMCENFLLLKFSLLFQRGNDLLWKWNDDLHSSGAAMSGGTTTLIRLYAIVGVLLT